MPYAVVQDGYAVFGVGETELEAIADARQWVSDPDSLKYLPGWPNFRGDTYISLCTDALVAAVKRDGGQIKHTLHTDGVVYLDDELDD